MKILWLNRKAYSPYQSYAFAASAKLSRVWIETRIAGSKWSKLDKIIQ
jgi:hypothetical protein